MDSCWLEPQGWGEKMGRERSMSWVSGNYEQGIERNSGNHI